jgi:hypothetical protein
LRNDRETGMPVITKYGTLSVRLVHYINFWKHFLKINLLEFAPTVRKFMSLENLSPSNVGGKF